MSSGFRTCVRIWLGVTLLAGWAATGVARAEDVARPATCLPIS